MTKEKINYILTQRLLSAANYEPDQLKKEKPADFASIREDPVRCLRYCAEEYSAGGRG